MANQTKDLQLLMSNDEVADKQDEAMKKRKTEEVKS